MSAGSSLALEKATPRRGLPRYFVKVPIDVIALRSGIPENLPGRCTDLSEGGVGAMVAGEFSPGQQVALEVRLPNVGVPLRARALVRHQGKVRCGFEFIGLAAEQRAMIRYWSSIASETNQRERSRMEPAPMTATVPRSRTPKVRVRWRLLSLIVAVLVLSVGVWWQWQRSWGELEKVTGNREGPLRVSPEIMAARIVSQVAPAYPEEARRAGTQGLVVLDAVIALDGTVRRLQPVSGNKILSKSAQDAVRQWRFQPYRSSGRAVEVETSIAVDFRLN